MRKLLTLFVMIGLGFGDSRAADPADLVITNALLVDGRGGVYDRSTIVVDDGRIREISKDNAITGQIMIDADGKTVMPGLMDVHVHLTDFRIVVSDSTRDVFLEQEIPSMFRKYLEYGVTTIKNTGDLRNAMLTLKARLESGQLQGPRLLVVGPPLTARGGHPAASLFRENEWFRSRGAAELGTASEARSTVADLARTGFDAIKLIFEEGKDRIKLAPEIMRAIIDESHRHNLRVTVHTKHEEDAIAVIEAGADGLEHGVILGKLSDQRLATLMRERGAVYVPTLQVIERFGPDDLLVAMSNLKQLAEEGVSIALGSDTFGNMPRGASTVREAELMVQAGLTTTQVIQAATHNAAAHLGILSDVGTVEPGKLADLIMMDGNPLADIAALRRIEVVIQSGEIVVDKRRPPAGDH